MKAGLNTPEDALRLPPWEWRVVYAVAAILGLALLVVAGQYGYSRDELYFLECGAHLAWGYPDQPPLVPFVAHLMSTIAPNSVTALRLPAVAASVAEVVLTSFIAREFGGGRMAQGLSAIAMAVSVMVLTAGHLLETITLALPLWALLIWLILRILRTRADRLWLVVGAVAGIALMDSDLVLGLLGTIIIGLLAFGPRRAFATKWFYIGVVVALAIWSPYLSWQAAHGWPELTVAHGIANGYSNTSTPRWLVLPLQLELVSVTLAPIWIAGLVQMIRGRYGSVGRAWAVAYGVLALAIVAVAGKDYYLAGMYPLLLAAGAQPTVDWIHRGRRWTRGTLIAAAVALSLWYAPVALPIIPVQNLHNTPIVAINPVAGDSVGWPTYVQEIAGVYHTLPDSGRSSAVIVTRNYGEAGAVDHFGQAAGLPAAYSGHMTYWYWGSPPLTATTVVAVGFSKKQLTPFFNQVRLATYLNNHLQVDNQEQGMPVWVCTSLREPWSAIWPHVLSLD